MEFVGLRTVATAKAALNQKRLQAGKGSEHLLALILTLPAAASSVLRAVCG